MIPSTPLSSEAEAMLHIELNSDEKLLWNGQPIPNRQARASIPLVLFGIPWTAFSVFWVVMASQMTGHASSRPDSFPFRLFPLLFPLFGAPFVLMGAGMLSSPWWMRRRAQKTVYALTDKRALILSPSWRGEIEVRSIPPEHLTDRTLKQNRDGSGSIVFTRLTTSSYSSKGGTTVVTVGFDNIADARDVDALMEQTYRAPEAG